MPFKPHISGNLNGRPKKPYSITTAFQKLLKAEPNAKAKIVKKVYEMALNGDVSAIKLIWSYMDGAPQQDITSGGESIIPHVSIATTRRTFKPITAGEVASRLITNIENKRVFSIF